ncbi:tRNA (adenosine(37)-N6)-dimethylallyltransferase MiaA [Candidatus Dependentiae bacterium]|nr:tRNA (adenosine(37)-N6)-dimethylallyltransferase MiaA [Candidatus Dependentiae bacterium]
MNNFIIVSGPTGVGKTDFVDRLYSVLAHPYEIINADVGQLYEPLTIGTAKPLYKDSAIPHHLFDVLKAPTSYTVSQWREQVVSIMHSLWERNVIPVIVGGSSFYISSLFFPPMAASPEQQLPVSWQNKSSLDLWQELDTIDTERARLLHPQDRYRIERALSLWYTQGKKPSECIPVFLAPGTCHFYYLTRDVADLYTRINERVLIMLEQGWIEEVRSLDDHWKQFLLEKKLIGYPDIVKYIAAGEDSVRDELEAVISQKTRNYAKRQLIFWRMLKKKLENHDPHGNFIKKIVELNLTGEGDNGSILEQLIDDSVLFKSF